MAADLCKLTLAAPQSIEWKLHVEQTSAILTCVNFVVITPKAIVRAFRRLRLKPGVYTFANGLLKLHLYLFTPSVHIMKFKFSLQNI